MDIKILIIFIGLLFCLIADAEAKNKKYSKDQKLSCEYFDSLKNENFDKCTSVNRGRKIELRPEGDNKELYKAAIELMSKYPEARKIITETGGKLEVKGWMVDLNDDGIEEAILFPMGLFRGASGNGDILIFKLTSKDKTIKWKFIGALQGMLLHIEESKSGHYYNLIAYWQMGSEWSVFKRYKMDLNSGFYKIVKEKELPCNIASEAPCFGFSLQRKEY